MDGGRLAVNDSVLGTLLGAKRATEGMWNYVTKICLLAKFYPHPFLYGKKSEALFLPKD